MTAYIDKMLIQILYKKLLFIEIYFMYSYHAHSRFRGSVNCWAPSMENRFQVAFFLFEVQKASSLFLSGPKWPRAHLGFLHWPQRAI